MEMQRTDDEVRIWWDHDEDRYIVGGPRWTWADDDESTVERDPDLALSPQQADRLVVELLRGPMGPQGPAGPMGNSAR